MSDAIDRMENAGILDASNLSAESRASINKFFEENEGAEAHMIAFHKHIQQMHPDNTNYRAKPNHSGIMY